MTARAPGLVVANLDAEAELAGRPGASGAAHAVMAKRARKLEVLCAPGDRLWIPGVDPPLERIPWDAGPVLAWCETESVARLRPRDGAGRPIVPELGGDPRAAPLRERLWSLRPPEPAVVRRVHHRAFALETARALGCALPGAEWLEDAAALSRQLARGGAGAGGRFVLKDPLSAAGRDRVIARVEEATESGVARRIERLFEQCRRSGGVLFEPWLDRQDDFGTLGLVTETGVELLGSHRQQVDPRDGRFLGVALEPPAGHAPIAADVREELRRVATAVGEALAAEGYRGPFGVDAWTWREGGMVRLNALGEVNARMTMGLVERVGASA